MFVARFASMQSRDNVPVLPAPKSKQHHQILIPLGKYFYAYLEYSKERYKLYVADVNDRVKLMQVCPILHTGYDILEMKDFNGRQYEVCQLPLIRLMKHYCAIFFAFCQNQLVLGLDNQFFVDAIAYTSRGYKFHKIGIECRPARVISIYDNQALCEILQKSIFLEANPVTQCTFPFLPLNDTTNSIVYPCETVAALPAPWCFRCRYTVSGHKKAMLNNCPCGHSDYTDKYESQERAEQVTGESAEQVPEASAEQVVEESGSSAQSTIVFLSAMDMFEHLHTGLHDMRLVGRGGKHLLREITGKPSEFKAFQWVVPEGYSGHMRSIDIDNVVYISTCKREVEEGKVFTYRMGLTESDARHRCLAIAGISLRAYAEGKRRDDQAAIDMMNCEVSVTYHHTKPVYVNGEYTFMHTSVPWSNVTNVKMRRFDFIGDGVYNDSALQKQCLEEMETNRGRHDIWDQSQESISAEKQKEAGTWMKLREFNRVFRNIHLLQHDDTVILITIRLNLPLNWTMQLFTYGYYTPNYYVPQDIGVHGLPPKEWFEDKNNQSQVFVNLASVSHMHSKSVSKFESVQQIAKSGIELDCGIIHGDDQKIQKMSQLVPQAISLAFMNCPLNTLFEGGEEIVKAESSGSSGMNMDQTSIQRMVKKGHDCSMKIAQCAQKGDWDRIATEKKLFPGDKTDVFHLLNEYNTIQEKNIEPESGIEKEPINYRYEEKRAMNADQITGCNYHHCTRKFRNAMHDFACNVKSEGVRLLIEEVKKVPGFNTEEDLEKYTPRNEGDWVPAIKLFCQLYNLNEDMMKQWIPYLCKKMSIEDEAFLHGTVFIDVMYVHDQFKKGIWVYNKEFANAYEGRDQDVEPGTSAEAAVVNEDGDIDNLEEALSKSWKDMRGQLHSLLRSMHDNGDNVQNCLKCSMLCPADIIDPSEYTQLHDQFTFKREIEMLKLYDLLTPTATTFASHYVEQSQIRGIMSQSVLTSSILPPLNRTTDSSASIFERTLNDFGTTINAVNAFDGMTDMLDLSASMCHARHRLLEIGRKKVASSDKDWLSVVLYRDVRSLHAPFIQTQLDRRGQYMHGLVREVPEPQQSPSQDTWDNCPLRFNMSSSAVCVCIYSGVFPLAPHVKSMLIDRVQRGNGRHTSEAVAYLKSNQTAGHTFAIMSMRQDHYEPYTAPDVGNILFDQPNVMVRQLGNWNVLLNPYLHKYFSLCFAVDSVEVDKECRASIESRDMEENTLYNPLYKCSENDFADETMWTKTVMLLAYIFDGGVIEALSHGYEGVSVDDEKWELCNFIQREEFNEILAYIVYYLNGCHLLDKDQCQFIAQTTIWTVGKDGYKGNATTLDGVPGGGKTNISTMAAIVHQIIALFAGKKYRGLYMCHANSATSESWDRMTDQGKRLEKLRSSIDISARDTWVKVGWEHIYDIGVSIMGTRTHPSHIQRMREKERLHTKNAASVNEKKVMGGRKTINGFFYKAEPSRFHLPLRIWGPRACRVFASRVQPSDVDPEKMDCTNFITKDNMAGKVRDLIFHKKALHLLLYEFTDVYVTVDHNLSMQSSIPPGMLNRVTVDEVGRLTVADINKAIAWYTVIDGSILPLTTVFMGDTRQPGPYIKTFKENCLRVLGAHESALAHLLRMVKMNKTHLSVSYRNIAPICKIYRNMYLPVDIKTIREFAQMFIDHPPSKEPYVSMSNHGLVELRNPIEYIPYPAGYQDMQSMKRNSSTNVREMLITRKVMEALDPFMVKHNLSGGIIAHYTGMVNTVKKELETLKVQVFGVNDTIPTMDMEDALSGEDDENNAVSKIGLQANWHVGTHDYWQGGQVDVTIVLGTRDLRLGHGWNKPIKVVTFSRARYVVIVIGELTAVTAGDRRTKMQALDPTDAWARAAMLAPQETTELQQYVIDEIDGLPGVNGEPVDRMRHTLREYQKWRNIQQGIENYVESDLADNIW